VNGFDQFWLFVFSGLFGFFVGVAFQRRFCTKHYLLALDHIEQMTKPGRMTTSTLPEAIKRLRDEVNR
jgi:hypothetical protein